MLRRAAAEVVHPPGHRRRHQ